MAARQHSQRAFLMAAKTKGAATLRMKLTRKPGTMGRRGSRCAMTVPRVRGRPSVAGKPCFS